MSKKKKRDEEEPAELAAAEAPREPVVSWKTYSACAFLAVFAAAAYSNSFTSPFLFDDDMHIVQNTAIRHLGPDAMLKHPNTTRPVIGLTLALNFAVGALNPLTYHIFNFGVHVLAGLLLFGIARRTFESERLRSKFGVTALPLALSIALLWVVHPLHTQAVTYIIQRCESLMGFFYLLTLYCVIRGSDSPGPMQWYALAVVSCALGMGCKQVMFFAPLVVLLYDRTFFSGSFAGALKKRWALYAPLAATAVIPIVLLQFGHGDRSVGAKSGLSPWTYLLTQAGVIPHYLKLALIPTGQCFTYKDWPFAQSIADVALPGLLMVVLLGLWFWGLLKNHPAGFLGTWFFLILAPSSSVMPIIDPAFEYRMYLSLASVAACVALLVYFLFAKLLGERGQPQLTLTAVFTYCGVMWLCASGLTIATHQRNKVYENKISLWKDVVEKRPKSIPGWANYGEALLDTDVAGAEHAFRMAVDLDAAEHAAKNTKREAPELYSNLGNALDKLGRREDALKAYETALEIRPDAAAYNNLGDIMMRQNRIPDAIDYFKRALKVKPEHTDSLYNLAKAYYDSKQYDDAAQTFEKLIKLRPEYAKAYTGLGGVHFIRNDFKKAIEYFTKAQEREPNDRDIMRNLALALFREGQNAAAEAKFKEVLKLHPDYAEAHASYAELLTAQGRTKEAEEEYQKLGTGGSNDYNREMTLAAFYKKQGNQLEFEKHLEAALKLDPKHAGAQFDLGTALLNRGKVPEAIEHLKIAVELNPKDLRARVALGNAYSGQGKFVEAIAQIESVVQADPNQTELRVGLGKLLIQTNRPADAASQFREAAKLNPNAIEPLLELGWLLNDNKTIGDPKAALEVAQKAAATAPKDARPHELLGAVNMKLGKVEDAISALEKGIELAKAAGNDAAAAGMQQQLDSVKKFLKKK